MILQPVSIAFCKDRLMQRQRWPFSTDSVMHTFVSEKGSLLGFL